MTRRSASRKAGQGREDEGSRERALLSVHIGVRAEVAEHLLADALVDEQIDPVAEVAALDPPLRPLEDGGVAVPVVLPAALPLRREGLLGELAKPLEQFVLQRQEELRTARVALPAGAALQLAV